jgi:hypothetical protein
MGTPWKLPAPPTDGPSATFEVDRRAGEYDQARDGTCVEQDGKLVGVPHGEVATFTIPAATTSMPLIDGWAYVGVPAGATLTLRSHPCTSRDVDGPWLDTYRQKPADAEAAAAQAAAEAAQPGTELVFVRGTCSVDAAAAVTRRCAAESEWFEGDEVPASCVTSGRAAHCTPVSIAQPGGGRASFLLAYGDRFAVCLGDDGAVVSTLRLPARP